MNILHIIATMQPSSGGLAQGLRNSIPEMDVRESRNEVVCLDDASADFVNQSPFPIHALGRARGSWGFHPDLMPWLRENLARFDVVLLHGLWLFPGHALRRVMAAAPDPPPFFVFAHGMLDPWFQKAPGRRLKAVRNWLYWKLIEHKVVRECAGLLFTCEQELRLARTTFRPYQPQSENNVGFGIASPPGLQPGMQRAFVARCPGLGGRPFLLFLSRIDVKKGVDLLIHAYAKWARDTAFMDKRLPALVIAGPGLETAHGKKMQELAASRCPPAHEGDGRKNLHEDPPAIFFPGMLAGDAKWGAFHGCEAFALPSHQENFGIAVVEALACGKPVLISDQVNIWREIDAAGAGLVETDTEEGVLNLLSRWGSASNVQNEQRSRNARAVFELRFTAGQAAQNLLTVLESRNKASLSSQRGTKSQKQR